MTNLQAPQAPSEWPTHRMTEEYTAFVTPARQLNFALSLLSEAATELRNNLGDDNVVLGRIQAFMREVRG